MFIAPFVVDKNRIKISDLMIFRYLEPVESITPEWLFKTNYKNQCWECGVRSFCHMEEENYQEFLSTIIMDKEFIAFKFTDRLGWRNIILLTKIDNLKNLLEYESVEILYIHRNE